MKTRSEDAPTPFRRPRAVTEWKGKQAVALDRDEPRRRRACMRLGRLNVPVLDDKEQPSSRARKNGRPVAT